MPRLTMSKHEQLNIIRSLRKAYKEKGMVTFKYDPNDLKTIRFQLPCDLQITITATGKGYVGIRHSNMKNVQNYSCYSYPDKVWLDYLVLDKNAFVRNDAWIGVKELDCFDNAQNIFSFIADFINDELFNMAPKEKDTFLRRIKLINQ